MFPKDGEDVPEIRFPEFTDAWEQRKLGEMGATFTGLSGKTKDDFGHGEAEFITYMNVFTNPIATVSGTESVEIDSRQSEVKYGDVLFTTSSETPEEVGMSSIWLANRANVYLNSFCFGWRPTIDIDPHYLAYMLRSSAVRKKFTFLAQGISRYNISKNKVMEMTVPMPCLDEQRHIGEFFTAISNLITLHQRAPCNKHKMNTGGNNYVVSNKRIGAVQQILCAVDSGLQRGCYQECYYAEIPNDANVD
jgi:type I restriction enzyme S subunit